MTNTAQTTIEHIEVASNRTYDQVTGPLQERLGAFGDSDRLRAQLRPGTSWAQIEKVIEGMMGSSGLAIFHKVEHGDLLSVAGKPRRVSQYSIGNPLLAIRMVQHEPAIAFYAHSGWPCMRTAKANAWSRTIGLLQLWRGINILKLPRRQRLATANGPSPTGSLRMELC